MAITNMGAIIFHDTLAQKPEVLEDDVVTFVPFTFVLSALLSNIGRSDSPISN